MILDRCPACAGPLVLYSEPDGDGSGVWLHSWFECRDCGRTTEARNCGGELLPVGEDDADG